MSKHFLLIEVPELPPSADDLETVGAAIRKLLTACGINSVVSALSEDELEDRFKPESLLEVDPGVEMVVIGDAFDEFEFDTDIALKESEDDRLKFEGDDDEPAD